MRLLSLQSFKKGVLEGLLVTFFPIRPFGPSGTCAPSEVRIEKTLTILSWNFAPLQGLSPVTSVLDINLQYRLSWDFLPLSAFPPAGSPPGSPPPAHPLTGFEPSQRIIAGQFALPVRAKNAYRLSPSGISPARRSLSPFGALSLFAARSLSDDSGTASRLPL